MNIDRITAGVLGCLFASAVLIAVPAVMQASAQGAEATLQQQTDTQFGHGKMGERLKERRSLLHDYCQQNQEVCQSHRQFHQDRRETLIEAKATVLGMTVDQLKAALQEKHMVQLITEAGFSAQEFHSQVQSQLTN